MWPAGSMTCLIVSVPWKIGRFRGNCEADMAKWDDYVASCVGVLANLDSDRANGVYYVAIMWPAGSKT